MVVNYPVKTFYQLQSCDAEVLVKFEDLPPKLFYDNTASFRVDLEKVCDF